MNDNLHDLEDDFIKKTLFEKDYVFELLNLKESDIISFYRQDAKAESYWTFCKELYLTKDNIIIVELKDIKLNDANIKIIPIKNLALECAEFKLFAKKEFGEDKIQLTLDNISLGDKLDNIIEKPISKPGFPSFYENYLHFKESLINIMLE